MRTSGTGAAVVALLLGSFALIPAQNESADSDVSIEKLSGCDGRSPRLERITARTAS